MLDPKDYSETAPETHAYEAPYNLHQLQDTFSFHQSLKATRALHK